MSAKTAAMLAVFAGSWIVMFYCNYSPPSNHPSAQLRIVGWIACLTMALITIPLTFTFCKALTDAQDVEFARQRKAREDAQRSGWAKQREAKP